MSKPRINVSVTHEELRQIDRGMAAIGEANRSRYIIEAALARAQYTEIADDERKRAHAILDEYLDLIRS